MRICSIVLSVALLAIYAQPAEAAPLPRKERSGWDYFWTNKKRCFRYIGLIGGVVGAVVAVHQGYQIFFTNPATPPVVPPSPQVDVKVVEAMVEKGDVIETDAHGLPRIIKIDVFGNAENGEYQMKLAARSYGFLREKGTIYEYFELANGDGKDIANSTKEIVSKRTTFVVKDASGNTLAVITKNLWESFRSDGQHFTISEPGEAGRKMGSIFYTKEEGKGVKITIKDANGQEVALMQQSGFPESAAYNVSVKRENPIDLRILYLFTVHAARF